MLPPSPTVSVVTPSLNQGDFIADCLESIQRQTCKVLEHIVIDGVSNDRTIDVLKSMGKDYPNIKWLSEKDNGQSDALNKGFRLAKGDWILWLNADDYVPDDAVEKFLEAVKAQPEADYVYGHVDFVDQEKRLTRSVLHIRFRYRLVKYGLYVPPTTGSFFRTSVLVDNPLDLDYHYTMDTEWFLRVGMTLKSILTDCRLSYFRVSEGNKTSSNIRLGTVKPRHERERIQYREVHYYRGATGVGRLWLSLVLALTNRVLKGEYYFEKLMSMARKNKQITASTR